MKKKSTWLIALLHLCYWLSNGTQPIYMFIIFRWLNIQHVAHVQTAGALLVLPVFYICYFFLFPFLQRRQIAKFITYSIATLVINVSAGYMFFRYFPGEYDWHVALIVVFFYLTMRVLGLALMAFLLRGFITWFTEIKYKQQLEKRNLETSLALLKAQINPHFLFNTLNNIDVLIEKEPAKASKYLNKLSDILRFTLYESPAETVSLQQEVSYIEQYLDLQKIRTANPDFVKFEVKGDMEHVKVAPMLFIPFIENAFKHCTNKKISNAIIITINSDGNNITFECSNAYEANLIETEQKGGLGLELIKNRLELLYRERYTLDVDKTEDRFTVNLKIYLNGN